MHIVKILKRTKIDENSKFDNYDNQNENHRHADNDNHVHDKDDYLHPPGHIDSNNVDDVDDDHDDYDHDNGNHDQHDDEEVDKDEGYDRCHNEDVEVDSLSWPGGDVISDDIGPDGTFDSCALLTIVRLVPSRPTFVIAKLIVGNSTIRRGQYPYWTSTSLSPYIDIVNIP